ncbi:hypothetical protein JYB62_07130 [Algoriphagus lutimaris]|uniref:hypothetical protein n=1 Tax=Algoriphagus lutimaris TaxID=613197 RepID=UPI00196B7A8C|nr:hypothetical protein [Algoriphagus lutimaris]MBN3519772.1 hypothetical protein [Algoriphagus lutimaris]
MSNNRYFKTTLLTFFSIVIAITFGCNSEDNDPTQSIQLTINGTVIFEDGDDFFGDIDGDFIGNGGSGKRTFLWQNSLNTADYNADITSSIGGFFEMEVKDADGKIVLNKSLQGGVEPDSFSGVTTSGTPGIWSVTITLTSFNGDGSFSLSEGD